MDILIAHTPPSLHHHAIRTISIIRSMIQTVACAMTRFAYHAHRPCPLCFAYISEAMPPGPQMNDYDAPPETNHLADAAGNADPAPDPPTHVPDPPADTMAYWLAIARSEAMSEDAICRLESIVRFVERHALANNADALAAVKRAEEIERIEAARRCTADAVTSRARELARASRHGEEQFNRVRDLNWPRSQSALCATGTSLYFSLDKCDLVLATRGRTWDWAARPGRETRHRLLANHIVAVPVEGHTEAQTLKKRWATVCAAHLRTPHPSRFLADWPGFVTAARKWNTLAERASLQILLPGGSAKPWMRQQ